MARLDYAAASTEYLRAPVTAREGGALVDPTATTVWMAFIARDDLDGGPVEDDWLDAEWETSGTTYYARVLIGPDGGEITLTPGYYRVWLKFSSDPELPVKSIGTLYVF